LANESGKREPGYEEVMTRLEEIVRRLEGGNLSLEDSLKAFEEGIGLVRAGEARLSEAERRVELLLSTPAGDQAVPFEPEARASTGGERVSIGRTHE